jgi:hypothetical protein
MHLSSKGAVSMKQYRYVVANNSGYSWAILTPSDIGENKEQNGTLLPQLLQEGWVPVRESPMGGGDSPLAHSLILLEKEAAAAKPAKAPRPAKKS